jgi:hypothetical protein
MGTAASRDSLIAVGRQHWRSFFPMWLFPIAFFAGIFVPGWSAHPAAYFFLFWFPLMSLCFWAASAPRRAGLATLWQAFFWAILVPFLIWGTIVFGIFGLAFVFHAV